MFRCILTSVLLMTSTIAAASENETCIRALLKQSHLKYSYYTDQFKSDLPKSFQDWKGRIIKNDKFPEFLPMIEFYKTKTLDAISVEPDNNIIKEVFQPLIKKLNKYKTNPGDYFEFLDLTAYFGLAMSLQYTFINNDLIEEHRKIDELEKMGITVGVSRRHTPPLRQRLKWFKDYYNVTVTNSNYPGSPNYERKQLEDAPENFAIQLPMTRFMGLTETLRFWIEGFHPVILTEKRTSEGWPGEAMTHDWRHGMEVGFSQEDKAKLRSLLNAIDSIVDIQFKLVVTILTFNFIHEDKGFLSSRPYPQSRKELGTANVILSIENSYFGDEVKNKLGNLPKENWIKAESWVLRHLR